MNVSIPDRVVQGGTRQSSSESFGAQRPAEVSGARLPKLNPQHDLAFVARIGGAMFVAGATLAAASLALPHQDRLNETGIALVALGAYLTAMVLFALAPRF